jgi:hypothetical protein
MNTPETKLIIMSAIQTQNFIDCVAEFDKLAESINLINR